jgi:hypothetical protein
VILVDADIVGVVVVDADVVDADRGVVASTQTESRRSPSNLSREKPMMLKTKWSKYFSSDSPCR